MKCYDIHDVVYSHNTNLVPALDDKQAVKGINNLIEFFNGSDKEKSS